MGKLFVGTSGFYYPHWKGNFYPESLPSPQYLSFYDQHFPTVEINSSFYRFPKTKTLLNWEKTVKPGFIFAFKVNRSFTHLKKLKAEKEELDKFFEIFAPFAKTKPAHLFLFQLPGNFKKNIPSLTSVLEKLPKGFFCTFEFRHISWFCKEVYRVLKKENAAIVLNDSPIEHGQLLWPKKDIETADFSYLRFHGSKSLYSSSYSDVELKEYVKIIKDKIRRGLDVFAYFNNDALGYAVPNAKKLERMCKS